MPYPNEHACRVREPGEFEPKSFRRIAQGKLSIIIGKLKGKSTTTTQAYRYPTGEWTEAEARKNCEDHGGRFEPAAKETAHETDMPDNLNPDMNPFIKMEDK